jgi:putative endonuclease
MNYVYILKSSIDHKNYIGSTNDLRRRFSEHQKGLVQSTKSRRPFKLIYYEAYESLDLARKREHSLKLKGKAYAQLYKRLNHNHENSQ